MNGLTLTQRARSEIAQIQYFGEERWGVRAARDYTLGMFETFEALALNPKIGRQSKVGRQEIRRFQYRAHVIIYLPKDNGAHIVTVKHAKSDWMGLLDSLT